MADQISKQISKQISTESGLSPPLPRKQYAKLTSELKDNFLTQIILGNKTIRQAAKNLKISYSSAKVIISDHKRSKKLRPKKNRFRKKGAVASYRGLELGE